MESLHYFVTNFSDNLFTNPHFQLHNLTVNQQKLAFVALHNIKQDDYTNEDDCYNIVTKLCNRMSCKTLPLIIL